MAMRPSDVEPEGASAPAAAPAARGPGRGRALRVVGVLLLAIAVAVAAVVVLRPDPERERPVGRLVAQDPAPQTSAVETTTTTASTPRSWTVSVLGRPAALGADGDPVPDDAGDLGDGAYLWNDFHGWHLWFVGAVDPDAAVTITSDDDIAKAEPVGGDLDVHVDGTGLTVRRGDDDEPIVGVDFNPGFDARRVVVTVDGDVALLTGGMAVPGVLPLEATYGAH